MTQDALTLCSDDVMDGWTDPWCFSRQLLSDAGHSSTSWPFIFLSRWRRTMAIFKL